jgi:hypothetical protein
MVHIFSSLKSQFGKIFVSLEFEKFATLYGRKMEKWPFGQGCQMVHIFSSLKSQFGKIFVSLEFEKFATLYGRKNGKMALRTGLPDHQKSQFV